MHVYYNDGGITVPSSLSFAMLPALLGHSRSKAIDLTQTLLELYHQN